jgi:hypothetical protein
MMKTDNIIKYKSLSLDEVGAQDDTIFGIGLSPKKVIFELHMTRKIGDMTLFLYLRSRSTPTLHP